MSREKSDHWSSEAYQTAASFVPKLATKIIQWLDPKPDDVILDIGCGDGVINLQIAEALSQGSGRIHGTDASPAMIETAKKAAKEANASKCTFEVVDAHEIGNTPSLKQAQFNKAFSNAALHWVLAVPQPQREAFFAGVRDTLAPGAVFAFEAGGPGNVAEMRAGLLMATARRAPGGLLAALAADPWFFPDERWVRDTLETRVGGWAVDRVEVEHRPTPADAGGVDGWVRLMGQRFFEAVPEGREREECIREVVDVLTEVCRNPSGGFTFGYVRMRVLARKL